LHLDLGTGGGTGHVNEGMRQKGAYVVSILTARHEIGSVPQVAHRAGDGARVQVLETDLVDDVGVGLRSISFARSPAFCTMWQLYSRVSTAFEASATGRPIEHGTPPQ